MVLALVVFLGAPAAAQNAPAGTPKKYPLFTSDDFVRLMKTVGRNFAGVNTSLTQKDFETAKAQLTRAREQLAITVTFWKDRKKNDAATMLREALTKMDALDVALSADPVDGTVVTDLARQVGTACQACHAVYREQDPATHTYRFKPGSVQ
jgi:hypothetical protein